MTVYNVAIMGLGIMGRRMLTAMTAHDRFHVGGVWDPIPRNSPPPRRPACR